VTRSIKHMMNSLVLVPVAILAVALIALNGYMRYQDANHQRLASEDLINNLLYQPATEALIVGDTLYFTQLIEDLMATTDQAECISLKDQDGATVVSKGQCPVYFTEEMTVEIRPAQSGFSDFVENSDSGEVLGYLTVILDRSSYTRKISELILQLLVSVVFVIGLSLALSRVIRKRLIEPMSVISSSMHKVAGKDYSERIMVSGNDELGELSGSINHTLDAIEKYVSEITLSQQETQRAMQEADNALIIKSALYSSLMSRIKEPAAKLHNQLTDLAVANQSPELQQRIKQTLLELQHIQDNIDGLIERSTHSEGHRALAIPYRPWTDVLAMLDKDIASLSSEIGVVVRLNVPSSLRENESPVEMINYLHIDGQRLRKTLVEIVCAMGTKCNAAGLVVNIEIVKLSTSTANLSCAVKGFYDGPLSPLDLNSPLIHSQRVPSVLNWSEHQKSVVSHSLRMLGFYPIYSTSPSGSVMLSFESTLRYSDNETFAEEQIESVKIKELKIAVVSNSISKLVTTEGDFEQLPNVHTFRFDELSNHDADLNYYDCVLIDFTQDLSVSVDLTQNINQTYGEKGPTRIAVLPPGQIKGSLSDKLFDLGLAGVLHKPLNISELTQTLHTVLISYQWTQKEAP